MRNRLGPGVFGALLVVMIAAGLAEAKEGAVPALPKVPMVTQDPLEAGQAALKAGQAAEAAHYFAQSQKARPKDMEPLLGLAAASQLQGRKAEARGWMDKALALQPANPGVLKAYGQLLVEQKKPDDIRVIYRPALADPACPLQTRLDYANWLLEALQRPAEAADAFRAALRQQPNSAEAALGVGLSLAADKRWEAALTALEEALRLDGSNPFAHQALGMVALRAGKAERALAAFDKALALRAGLPLATLGRGDALVAMNRVPLAVEAYRAAIKLMPDRPAPYIQLAQLLERENRLAEAEPLYREAVRLAPDNAVLKNNLAFVLSQLGKNLDEALGLIKAAEKAEPGRAPFIDTRGSVLLAAGDVAGARASFEQALKLDPNNALFKRHLAQASGAVARPAATQPAQPVAAAEAAKPAVAPVPAAPVQPVVSGAATPAGRDAGAPVVKVVADPAKVIGPTVEAWRSAWARKDIPAYLGFYGKGFEPGGGKGRAAWESDRRAKLDKPGDISVKLESLAYIQSGETITVVFDQHFTSSTFKDVVRKELVWTREGEQWRIQRERLR